MAGAQITRNHIVRLETDGRADQTLNLNAIGNNIVATAIQPDGKMIIAGRFKNILGVPRNYVARLNTDGTLDGAFNPSPNNDVDSIVVAADGKISSAAHSPASAERSAIASPDSTPLPARRIRSIRMRTMV